MSATEIKNPLRFKNHPLCGLLIENGRGEVLLQLRDNKPSIPYPNCWGTFGGQIEEGELPEAAIMREIEEELGYRPNRPEQYGVFHCDGYDVFMFRCVDTELRLDGLKVQEGQRASFFSYADLDSAQFAFNCKDIVQDYFKRFHPEVTVFIGLGSNMGKREELLKKALERIEKLMPIQAASSVYETEPVGYEAQDWFLNMVIQGATRLFPAVLLERLQDIETALGRQRDIANGPRTIDLDILLYGDAVMATEHITVPHPRLHERAFVLAPLAEIAPTLEHPVLHKNMAALLALAGRRKKVIKRRPDSVLQERRAIKRLMMIAGTLCLLAGAILIAGLNTGRILKHVVNTYGPALTKTEVRLGDVDIQLFDAQATLKDLYIGKLQGSSLPKLLSARSVFIRFERASLLGNPLVIDRLEIDAPDIACEKTGRTDNFKALLKNMESTPSGASAGLTDNATAAPEKKKKKSRKVVIRELVIKNAQVTAFMGPQGGKKQTLTLSELRLNNVGGSSGARPEKIARQILSALYETIHSNSGQVNRMSGTAGNSAQSVGEGEKKTIDKGAEGIKKLFGK